MKTLYFQHSKSARFNFSLYLSCELQIKVCGTRRAATYLKRENLNSKLTSITKTELSNITKLILPVWLNVCRRKKNHQKFLPLFLNNKLVDFYCKC